MIEVDSHPIPNPTAEVITMDRDLLRYLLLQGNAGDADTTDTRLDMSKTPGNSDLQPYLDQNQQSDSQLDLQQQILMLQEQHRRLVYQQQHQQQQHPDGMFFGGIDSSISFQQSNNIDPNNVSFTRQQDNRSTTVQSNSGTSSAAGFAPGGLLHSFFTKQDAESLWDQDQLVTSHQQQGRPSQLQQGLTNSLPSQGGPGGGNSVFPDWMIPQQTNNENNNVSVAGLNRWDHYQMNNQPLLTTTTGGASNDLVGNHGHDMLSQVVSSTPSSQSNAFPFPSRGIPDSLSHARLSAPSLLVNNGGVGFVSGDAPHPSSVTSIAANKRNQEWSLPPASLLSTEFGSSGSVVFGVVNSNVAGLNADDSKECTSDDHGGATNSAFEDNGTIGPWSAASAALLGDLALDSEDKGRKQRRKTNKDKPKRPLSAYNIFFKEERERLLEELPEAVLKVDGFNDDSIGAKKRKTGGSNADNCHASKTGKKKPHGKIDFQSLAKVIGKRWQNLTESDLQMYKAKANADMKRYRDEMDAYNTSVLEAKEK